MYRVIIRLTSSRPSKWRGVLHRGRGAAFLDCVSPDSRCDDDRQTLADRLLDLFWVRREANGSKGKVIRNAAAGIMDFLSMMRGRFPHDGSHVISTVATFSR